MAAEIAAIQQQLRWRMFPSPFGNIRYLWRDHCCQQIELNELPSPSEHPQDDPVFHWLTSYFAGQPHPLPMLATPRSEFQHRLRQALWQIPPGSTRSYGQLARDLHSAPRAVGQALHANPLPLLVPCHRVVSTHTLGGFAFGPQWKQRLLQFESKKGVPSL